MDALLRTHKHQISLSKTYGGIEGINEGFKRQFFGGKHSNWQECFLISLLHGQCI